MKESDTKERNLVKRSTNRRFQLCGRQLHQMLTVVCSNRRGKRSVKETEGSIGMYVLLEYLSRDTSDNSENSKVNHYLSNLSKNFR